MADPIVLKVQKDLLIRALNELIKEAGELLLKSPYEYYDRTANHNKAIGIDLAMGAAASQVRQGAVEWCTKVQETIGATCDGFNLSDVELIGHNRMFPRVSVLRDLVASIECYSVGISHASISSAHPKISSRCSRNFLAGHYDDAVFEAFKALESEVRNRIKAPLDEVGTTLIKRAMSPAKPRLQFSPVISEQESVFALFRGAIGFLKNPLSHRFLSDIDSTTAAEAIAFASMLMRLLDKAVDNSTDKSEKLTRAALS